MLRRIVFVLLAVGLAAAQSSAPSQTAESRAPLTVEWSGLPDVNVNVVKGSVVVANQADDDFDQTVIVEAVNEVGKAFALGYQHFTLRKHTRSIPISFETKLPPGHYQLHADAVAEIPSKNAIYRQHIEGPVGFAISAI